MDPGLLNVLTMAGHTHRKLLTFEKAVECFGKALALAPDNPYALFGMADSLRGLGRFDEAAPYWEAILGADPRNQQVLARAGDCFLRLDLTARAEELFNRSLAIGYDKASLLGLGRIHRQRAAFEAEILCYEQILTRNPADERTALLRAEAVENGKHRGNAGPPPASKKV
jgi:tetratricopeptide (TPR) repeat protein